MKRANCGEALLLVVLAAVLSLGAADCCGVRHVRARRPRYCAFDADSYMCSAASLGSECLAINNYGISTGAGFHADFVALAKGDSGCTDALLAFFCSNLCGDCVAQNDTFVRRAACREFATATTSTHTQSLTELTSDNKQTTESAESSRERVPHWHTPASTQVHSSATKARCRNARAASA